ncbi:hypothetical protein PQX77_014651 [Marasmius sp. AFHP31]|nr:hypothetical protein PQX77_014651 [Marasmius sp. AFHP31]
MLMLFEQAFKGQYSLHENFTEQDVDMAFLVKAFSGSKLLYVFQKLTGFTSALTVWQHLEGPDLSATSGRIDLAYLKANIKSALSPTVEPPPPNPKSGNILMADDVAMEEQCQWDDFSNEVKGIACESADHVPTFKVETYQSIVDIFKAMDPELPKE